MYVGLPFAHVFEVRSASGGAVISTRRERRTTACQTLIEFSTRTFVFRFGSFFFEALEPAEQIRKYLLQKAGKTRRSKSKPGPDPV